MLNENEINAVKGLMHYLNTQFDGDLAADVSVIDSNGETLCRIKRVDDTEYQFLPGSTE